MAGYRRTDHHRSINAAMRARCLAELGEALGEARRLLAELTDKPPLTAEVVELAQSVEKTIRQVEQLRRGRPAMIDDVLGPKWLESARDRRNPPA